MLGVQESEMDQTWITGPGELEMRRVPIPRPAGGEVLVQMTFAGICGSDLHTYRRGHPWLEYPIAPGHESVGVVAELGANVDSTSVGQPVYLRPGISCGNCFYCRRDRPNLCSAMIGIGSHIPGAFADYFLVPEAGIAPVPDRMPLPDAAMIEPLATAVHAAAAAGGFTGRTVAILGGGSIGLSVMLVALAEGAAGVVVADPVPSKRELAMSLGADAAINATDPELADRIRDGLHGRPDVTIDCVANAGSVQSAAALAARGGTVVLVGVGHGPVEIPIETIQDQEVRIGGSAMYVPEDFVRAEKLVLAGTPVSRLISAVYPLSDLPKAFAAALTGQPVKIHVHGVARGGLVGKQ